MPFENLQQELISLKDIKVNYYQKRITVRGCIIRVNRPYEMATTMVLLCKKCNTPHVVELENGIYEPEKKCSICGARKFIPDLQASEVETTPLQVVRIQEHFGDLDDQQGRVPRVMDIELQGDLVNTCMPGDDVTVTGIVKMQGTDNGVNPKANFVNPLYIEVKSIVNNDNKAKNTGSFNVEFNASDYKAIMEIHESDDILSLLVNSLCPGIYGHEMIKMALLLSLFGGCAKHTNLRENIHVLIVGDPGLGKSQMLQACSRIAPKGIYVSGNASTSSGLTATLVRESGQMNDFALEPGALVLADRGCCCIDEFDKMPTQHQALLEAMEQQSVSVAKSGVIWSLPSRTSILAAANPIGGRYDKSKTLCRNLNMSQPLLSRFDLVFMLLDQPDPQKDNFLAGHVMLMHTGKEHSSCENLENFCKSSIDQSKSLKKKLSLSFKNSSKSLVAPLILRKYISYAKQYVKPTLSEASADVIQKYYLKLRSNLNNAVNINPCTRQLEAMIRLTEARAKLDLRESTTEQDVFDVIELLESSVIGMEDPQIENSLPSLSLKKTSRNFVKVFLELLTKDFEDRGVDLYSKNELKNLAAKGGLTGKDVLSAIDKLNEQGYLISKGNNMYKVEI